MTWDEIYEAAIDKGCGEPELVRKDNARYEVVGFIEDNFGFNIEQECEKNLIECVEDWIDTYSEHYSISFDEQGHIIGHNEITLKDKACELLMYYEDLADRCNKDFETLDIALNILRELRGE